jgi:hypothetical protein
MARVNTPEALDALVDSANQMRDEADAQSKWLSHQMERISDRIQRLTPFFEERAAAALARTEDIRLDVATIMNGLETLGLFVGKDVVVEQITEGDSAPADVPLTLQQRRLYANEELAVFRAVSPEFDVRDEGEFFSAMRDEPALVDQVFTAQRAVVMMAVRANAVHYGDDLAAFFKSMKFNRANLATFFLVRNGGNIYRVFSPEVSHEAATHLFPMQGEQDRIFRGIDSSQITFDDVRYTDALQDHERYLVHYRRILILLFGLQFRDGILGNFFPDEEAGQFLSLEFQQRYFRFVRDADGDGSALTDGRPGVRAWLRDHYNSIQHGSMVLCDWRLILKEASAPAAFSSFEGYRPKSRFSVCQVDFSNGSPVVKVEVHGQTNRGVERSFRCSVDLSEAVRYTEPGLVCLDSIDSDDLLYYVHNRAARGEMLDHVALFIEGARRLARDDSVIGWVDSLSSTLEKACGCPEVAKQIARIAARFSNDGSPPCSDYATSLSWLASMVTDPESARAFVGERVSADVERIAACVASGRLVAFLVPDEAEKDDRLEPFCWLRRVYLAMDSKAAAAGGRWVPALHSEAGTIPVLGAVPAKSRIEAGRSAFASPSKKARFLDDAISLGQSLAESLSGGQCPRELCDLWRSYVDRLHRNNKSQFVVNANAAVPVGACLTGVGSQYLCLSLSPVHTAAFLDRLTSGTLRPMIRAQYAERYSSSSLHAGRFDSAVSEVESVPLPWNLCVVGASNRVGPYWSGVSALNGETLPADFSFTRQAVAKWSGWLRASNVWIAPDASAIFRQLHGVEDVK